MFMTSLTLKVSGHCHFREHKFYYTFQYKIYIYMPHKRTYLVLICMLIKITKISNKNVNIINTKSIFKAITKE